MIVYDAQRRPVELGKAVGHGGEATVYQIANQPGRLTKIYEPEPRPNYAGKLDWMVNHPPENPTQGLDHPSLAWPSGLIFDSRRRLKGYWMPYIQHAVPMLDVFNPRRRAEVLPDFDRRYLMRTARNLAAALSALHSSGYVAGDLNESNVLVTSTALVTLIDTDSFQVREDRDGKQVVHPCPVGKPEYTPPELQRQALSELIRQPDHDAFGLAVLIFQLLMEGSHPFRAQWLAAGDPPPLEVRIANGAYPYVEKPAYPVLPPKNTVGIETLHPWLAELFQRCFVDGHRDPRWRPGPDLWVRALSEAEQAQIRCANGHYYASHLHECPYCALKQKRAEQAQKAPSRRAPAGRAQPNWPPRRTPAGSPFVQSRPAAGVGVGAPAAAGAASSGPVVGGPTFRVGPAVVTTPATSASARPAAAGAASTASSTTTRTTPPGSTPFFGSTGGFFSRVTGWSPPPAPGSSRGSYRGFPGGASIFGYPAARPGSLGGVLRSSRPVITPTSLRNWARQRTLKSLTVGAAQGAMAGAVPGLAIGLINWAGGSLLAWPLLFALGGVSAGLLRGWTPGHKLAALIDRFIGWKLFWQGMGLVGGVMLGGLFTLPFIWAIIPFILGLVLGGQAGLFLGKKLWQVGSGLGWERIWGAFSAVGFGALGYGVAQLTGLLGLNSLGTNLAGGLMPFAANGELWWAVVWMMAGGAGSALAGALAGLLTDLLGRFSGLVD